MLEQWVEVDLDLGPAANEEFISSVLAYSLVRICPCADQRTAILKVGPIDKDKAVSGRLTTSFFVKTLSLRHPIMPIDYTTVTLLRMLSIYNIGPHLLLRREVVFDFELNFLCLGMKNGASIYYLSSI